MKITLAIREADSSLFPGLRSVKIWIKNLHTDYTYQSSDKKLQPGTSVAQASAYCLPGDEESAVIDAYVKLYMEYSNVIDTDHGTTYWSTLIPYPGKWLKSVPRFQSEEGRSTMDAQSSDWHSIEYEHGVVRE